MIVIASAAYVDGEFRSEVGDLPPVMLPVGNKRLFEYQIGVLREKLPNEDVYLTLPEEYRLPAKDEHRLNVYGITTVQVPSNLRLADSLLYAINYIGRYDDELYLLHGDTLIYDLPAGGDIVAISSTNNDYGWEVVDKSLSEEIVWSGYFSFINTRYFVKCLTLSMGGFVDAVKRYYGGGVKQYKEVLEWYDFGHINNYFVSRSRMPVRRYFNEVNIKNGVVVKSSFNDEKINCELEWFKNVPDRMRFYMPQVLGNGVNSSGESYYEIEYLSCLPLNEIFVHALNPPFFWNKIFDQLKGFFLDCIEQYQRFAADSDSFDLTASYGALVVDKMKSRLDAYKGGCEIDFDMPIKINGADVPSLNYIVSDCVSRVDLSSNIPGVLHGDLCFSNVLYDSRGDRIKVIDPRGMSADGDFSFIGDLRYDFSKLNHSVIGLYDHIISGSYELYICNEDIEFNILIDVRVKEIQGQYIGNMSLMGVSPLDLIPETILLFFSMLPLHHDDRDRQHAFIANAIRLYDNYIVSN